jgi:uncharacterized pyridoxamine 5'-phosphate oxidase family protein
MTRQDIIAFITRNPASFLATADGDMPHVRGILIYRADGDGILFHTGTFKHMYDELTMNPNAEFCFWSPAEGLQIRVKGPCETVEDPALKQEIVLTRPFLKPWIDQNGYEGFKVFRMKPDGVTVWTMQNNFARSEWVPF